MELVVNNKPVILPEEPKKVEEPLKQIDAFKKEASIILTLQNLLDLVNPVLIAKDSTLINYNMVKQKIDMVKNTVTYTFYNK